MIFSQLFNRFELLSRFECTLFLSLVNSLAEQKHATGAKNRTVRAKTVISGVKTCKKQLKSVKRGTSDNYFLENTYLNTYNCFTISGPKARRKFGCFLLQKPLENVVFQWKIAQKGFRKALNFRLRRTTD